MVYRPGLGIWTTRASATLPQTAVQNLFTIAGGAVRINFLLGRCSVVMGAVANNTSLEHTVGPTVLCAVLNTANDVVETLYQISGDPAEPLRRLLAGTALAAPGGYAGGLAAGAGLIANGIIASTGSITLRCAANNTGESQWDCFWVPLTNGATLVAA